MLKSVHFEGIKSLLDVTVDLEPFTVLVGPNGCGKSTILDMTEFVTESTRWDPSLPNVFSTGGEIIRNTGADRLRTQSPSVPLVASAEDTAGNTFRVRMALGPAVRWYEGFAMDAITPAGTRTLGYSTAPQENHAFGEHVMATFGWRAHRLALIPRFVAARSDVMVNELRADGYGLPTVLRDLAANHPNEFRRLTEDMERVVKHFRGLKWGKAVRNPDDPAQSPMPLATLDLLMSNGTIPASESSDGTLVALATLTAVHHPELPPLILIDDIDHGLHLGAQFEMIKAIRAVQKVRPDLQVVCTTHSPILLDAFDVSEVRVMALDAEGHTVVRPLADHPDIERFRPLLQTGELWASFGEDWVTEQGAKGA